MSMWGAARGATKMYLKRLNAQSAVTLVSGGFKKGMATGGYKGAIMGAASGARRWAWTAPRTSMTRGIRIGTAAAGAGATYMGGRSIMSPNKRRMPPGTMY